jgi:hypothetical protein
MVNVFKIKMGRIVHVNLDGVGLTQLFDLLICFTHLLLLLFLII